MTIRSPLIAPGKPLVYARQAWYDIARMRELRGDVDGAARARRMARSQCPVLLRNGTRRHGVWDESS